MQIRNSTIYRDDDSTCAYGVLLMILDYGFEYEVPDSEVEKLVSKHTAIDIEYVDNVDELIEDNMDYIKDYYLEEALEYQKDLKALEKDIYAYHGVSTNDFK